MRSSIRNDRAWPEYQGGILTEYDCTKGCAIIARLAPGFRMRTFRREGKALISLGTCLKKQHFFNKLAEYADAQRQTSEEHEVQAGHLHPGTALWHKRPLQV